MKKIIFLLVLCFTCLSNINFANASTYTLTSNVSTNQEFASNMPYTITAKITSGTPIALVPITFKGDWMASGVTNSTTPAGETSWKVTMPKELGAKTLTFSISNEIVLSVPIVIVKGIVADLEYDPVQYWEPGGYEDIIIYATAINTYDNTPIYSPSWAYIQYPSGLIPSVQQISGTAKYKITFAMNVKSGGTYDFTITPSAEHYLSVSKKISIYVGSTPVLKTILNFDDGHVIQFNGTNPSGGISDLTKNNAGLDIYIYDTKGNVKDGVITYFRISSSLPVYTNIPTKISEGHYRVDFVFEESTYSMEFDVALSPFATLKARDVIISTVTHGFDIFTFIVTPYFLVPFSIFVIWIVFKIFKRGKKREIA